MGSGRVWPSILSTLTLLRLLVEGQRGIALIAVTCRTQQSNSFIIYAACGVVFVCCSISDLVILFYILLCDLYYAWVVVLL